MGNKASAPVPSTAQLVKRFSDAELRRLEAQCPPPSGGGAGSSGSSRKGVVGLSSASPRGGGGGAAASGGGGALMREAFMRKFGEGLGPVARRVLLRLFRVLDANGSGGLEYEEYLAAAFFFTKATPAERARVLFSMYESPPPSSSSSSSSSAAAGYLTRADLASLCAEATWAATEQQAAHPPSILAQLGANTVSSGSSGRAAGKEDQLQQQRMQRLDVEASPFRELAAVMAEAALTRYDADRDGRLSVAEFQQFAQQPDTGVEALLQILVSSPYVQEFLPAEGGR